MKRFMLWIGCLCGVLAVVAKSSADNKAAPKRHEVGVVRDINYNDRPVALVSPKQRLDLYIPKGVKNAPVVMFIHGGGYQRGDRDEGQPLGRILAARGIVTAVMSYRLYPEVKHPGQIEDVARSFAWLKRNVAKHGGNPASIFISGHSAGAHLAALLATDKSYLKAENLAVSDIGGVIALSGGYRILAIRKDVFGDEKAMEQASPFSHISKGHPPFLIVFGADENQDRHNLSNEFRDALRKAGGHAECLKVADRDHKGLFTKLGDGDPATEALLAFVSRWGK